jgi:hypothetical protein
MVKQKSKGVEKVSYSDIVDVITVIVRESDSQKVGPISNSEVQAYLKIEKGIEVTDQTIRNKGLRKNGYFEKKYPDICSFINYGDTRMRGLVVKKDLWLEEVES